MGCLAVFLWGVALGSASAEVRHLASAQTFLKIKGSKTIFVDPQISTWKTKGVMYWDVEGSLLTKLSQVGFHIVRSATDPHELTLHVDYRELKGEPFAVNRFGTIIECQFALNHVDEGPLLTIHIRETSHPTVTGTPPYLDVLHNFLTNPYYHFLEEILWGEINGIMDPHHIFIRAMESDLLQLQKRKEFDPVSGHVARPQHSMPLDKHQYAPVAFRRTIDELVRVNDTRLISILTDLVRHPDVYVQVRSIEAFGDFGAKEYLPFLETLKKESSLVEVQTATQRTIDILAGISLN